MTWYTVILSYLMIRACSICKFSISMELMERGGIGGSDKKIKFCMMSAFLELNFL